MDENINSEECVKEAPVTIFSLMCECQYKSLKSTQEAEFLRGRASAFDYVLTQLKKIEQEKKNDNY